MITLIFYVLFAHAPESKYALATYTTRTECEENGNRLEHDTKGSHYICRPLAVHVDQTNHKVTTEIML